MEPSDIYQCSPSRCEQTTALASSIPKMLGALLKLDDAMESWSFTKNDAPLLAALVLARKEAMAFSAYISEWAWGAGLDGGMDYNAPVQSRPASPSRAVVVVDETAQLLNTSAISACESLMRLAKIEYRSSLATDLYPGVPKSDLDEVSQLVFEALKNVYSNMWQLIAFATPNVAAP